MSGLPRPAAEKCPPSYVQLAEVLIKLAEVLIKLAEVLCEPQSRRASLNIEERSCSVRISAIMRL